MPIDSATTVIADPDPVNEALDEMVTVVVKFVPPIDPPVPPACTVIALAGDVVVRAAAAVVFPFVKTCLISQPCLITHNE